MRCSKGDKLTLDDIERVKVLPGNTVFYGRPLSITAIDRKVCDQRDCEGSSR